MSIRSMTGFARLKGQHEGFDWTWEVKSVNAKGFDCRVRVPAMLDGLDIAARKRAAKSLARGTIMANLEVKVNGRDNVIRVNRAILEQLLDLTIEFEKQPTLGPSSLADLLSLRGVVELCEGEISADQLEQLSSALLEGFDRTLAILNKARSEEGMQMAAVVALGIQELKGDLKEAKACDGARIEAIKQRFSEKVSELLEGDRKLDPDKLEQEVAYMAVKADIREELDRLDAHLETAMALLDSDDPVGREFDFLAQELNREANTLCSKSGDKELTKTGLAMKLGIDQLREQIQNIE
jgi:uncharacterized protein (TIGR00255 family)